MTTNNNVYIYKFIAQAVDPLERLDVFLHHHLPSYSRTFFQALIHDGYVQVNEKIITKPSMELKVADKITVSLPLIQTPAPSVCSSLLHNLGVKILFTHEHFFIIEKPAGLIVHKTLTNQQQVTLVDWLLNHCQELQSVGSPDRPGIIHRLDKDTSGLLIIARTNYAHLTFGTFFKNRAINKTYYAVVQGHPAQSGTIDFPIERHPQERHRMTHTLPFGRPSITHYKVLHHFKDHALLELQPLTGRTHQIRVHCAAIGHPIVGDKVYGSASKLINRQALHAGKLSFIFEGHEYTFTSSLPADFENLLKQLS